MVAEARLNEVRAKAGVSAATVAGAEERLAKAQRGAALAADGSIAAQKGLRDAELLAAGAADKLTVAERRAGLATEKAGVRAGVMSGRVAKFGAAGATAMKGVGASALTTASHVAKLGLGLGALGAADFVAHGVKNAVEFQRQLTLLSTAGGEAAKNLPMISKGIQNIAVSTGTSTSHLAEGMYTIEKAGIRGGRGLDVLKASAQGARAEGADLATMTNAVTSVMASYGSKMRDPVKVTNELVAAAGASKTTMQNFAGSLSTVVPIAAKAGLSFDQVGGAIATMTSHGTSADEATQQLAFAIRNLQAPNHVAVNEMAQLGISSNDVATKLGKRGLQGTIDYLSGTVLKRMGPSGTLLLKTFNQSKVAAGDAQQMFGHLTGKTKDLAAGLMHGTVSQKQFTKGLAGLGPVQKAMGRQFETTFIKAHTFNSELRQGGQPAQTYNDAMKKMMGGANGLNVALMLTGESSGKFAKSTREIGVAGRHAGKDIFTWKTEQKLLTVQLSRLKETVTVLGIRIGTFLLPYLTRMATWILNKGIPAVSAFYRGTLRPLAEYIISTAVPAFKAIYQDGVKPLFNFLSKHRTVAKAIAVGIGAMALAWKGYAIFQDLAKISSESFMRVGIIGLIIGIGAALVYAYKHSETFRRIVNRAFADVSAAARVFAGWMQTGFHAIKPTLLAIGHALKTAFTAVVGFVRSAIPYIQGAFTAVVGFVRSAIRFIRAAFTAVVGFVRGAVGGIVGAAKGIWGAVSRFWAKDGGRLTAAVKAVFRFVANSVRNALHIIQGVFKIFKGLFTGNWHELWAGLKQVVGAVWAQIVNYVRTGLALLKNLLPIFGKGLHKLWGLIWSGLKKVPGLAMRAIRGGISLAWKGIKAIFSLAWDGLVAGAKLFLKIFIAFWYKLPKNILKAIGGVVGHLKQKGIDFIAGLLAGLVHKVQDVWAWFKRLSRRAASYIGNVVKSLAGKGRDLITGLWNGIKAVWKDVAAYFGGAGKRIGGFFAKAGGWLYNAGLRVINGLWGAIKAAWKAVSGFFGGIGKRIGGFFRRGGGWLYDAGLRVINGLWGGIKAVWKSVSGFFSSRGRAIGGFFSHAGGYLYDAGLRVVHGLWNGIKAVWRQLGSWLGKLGGWIAAPFKKIGSIFANVWQDVKHGLSVALKGIVVFLNNYLIKPLNKVLGAFSVSIPIIPVPGVAPSAHQAAVVSGRASTIANATKGPPISTGGSSSSGHQNSIHRQGLARGGVPVLPGYSPGRDVHHFTSPTAGRLDLSGGEGILIPEATRALGGAQGIRDINSRFRSGLGRSDGRHFSPGGVLGTLTSAVGAVGQALQGSGGPGAGIGFGVSAGAKGAQILGPHIADAVFKAARGAVGHLPKGMAQRIGKGAEAKIEAAARAWLLGQQAWSGGGGAGGWGGGRQSIIDEASKQLGKMYLWGAKGPNRFDCSGFTGFTLRKLGINAPEDSRSQYQWAKGYPDGGGKVGDLGFWDGAQHDPGAIHHVAFNAGPNRLLEAAETGTPVRYAPMRSRDTFMGWFGYPGLDKLAAARPPAPVGGGGGYNAKAGDLGAYHLPSSVTRWAPTVASVLSELHQPLNLVGPELVLMNGESSGQQFAVNHYDRNAQAGYPSTGLIQIIRPTFQQWAGRYAKTGPFMNGVSVDPHANVFSGVNYAIGTYGSVLNTPGIKSVLAGGGYKPYDAGGTLPPGHHLTYNGTGENETIRTGMQERNLQVKLGRGEGRGLSPGDHLVLRVGAHEFDAVIEMGATAVVHKAARRSHSALVGAPRTAVS